MQGSSKTVFYHNEQKLLRRMPILTHKRVGSTKKKFKINHPFFGHSHRLKGSAFWTFSLKIPSGVLFLEGLLFSACCADLEVGLHSDPVRTPTPKPDGVGPGWGKHTPCTSTAFFNSHILGFFAVFCNFRKFDSSPPPPQG